MIERFEDVNNSFYDEAGRELDRVLITPEGRAEFLKAVKETEQRVYVIALTRGTFELDLREVETREEREQKIREALSAFLMLHEKLQ